jgi:hypothetical protein
MAITAVSHTEGSVTLAFSAAATALTAGVSAGAVSLPVTGGTGTNFTAGQLILIEGGSSAELARVSGPPTSSAIPVQALGECPLQRRAGSAGHGDRCG